MWRRFPDAHSEKRGGASSPRGAAAQEAVPGESHASCDFISKTPAATWPRCQEKKRPLCRGSAGQGTERQ